MNNPDEAGNPLFAEGDRNRWYMLQPYLIAILMCKGQPMLWQGEEFGENYFFRIWRGPCGAFALPALGFFLRPSRTRASAIGPRAFTH